MNARAHEFVVALRAILATLPGRQRHWFPCVGDLDPRRDRAGPGPPRARTKTSAILRSTSSVARFDRAFYVVFDRVQ